MDFFSPNGMGASFCALCFGTEFARQALIAGDGLGVPKSVSVSSAPQIA